MNKNFVWGTATASYQIEGAVKEDGRGESVWDVFCRDSGRVANGDTGDVACDHYHRVPEDIALIKKLGVDSYRFSVAWPRVLPNGIGPVNQKGVDFYNRIVDGLLEKDIRPWLTFFHWDLPQALQDKGGFTNRDSVKWFNDYCQVVAAALGDRVRDFILINEPSTFAMHGHFGGEHAPGLKSQEAMLKAMHHQNLAITSTYRQLKAQNPNWNIGSSYTIFPTRPASDKPQDQLAALIADAVCNGAYFDPLLKGEYPPVMQGQMEGIVQPGDMETLRCDLDFVGLQHYAPFYYRAGSDGSSLLEGAPPPAGQPVTHMDWAIDPAAFHECLMRFAQMYNNPPVYITENGAAYLDVKSPDGEVHDAGRVAHYKAYIAEVEKAMKDGADIRGYFAWSLMDNFEWGYGYDKRFGLVHVDYATQQRTPKDSYKWYRDFIAAQRLQHG